MSLCDKCVSGVRHEGTPEGKIEVIGSVNVYVATPTVDYPKDKAVLFLPDVFGIELPNAKLLADDFARNGFKTYAIDYFNGDPIDADALNPENPDKFNFEGWLENHKPDDTRPYINKVIAALKKEGVEEFAATGYCFGGRHVFDLAFNGDIKVSAVAHPSFLKTEDLGRYAKTDIPLLINSCEFDNMFPLKDQTDADDIIGGGGRSASYERKHFEGCTHGFAVRGDLSNPVVKAGKEGAFRATVEFFLKHLYGKNVESHV